MRETSLRGGKITGTLRLKSGIRLVGMAKDKPADWSKDPDPRIRGLYKRALVERREKH